MRLIRQYAIFLLLLLAVPLVPGEARAANKLVEYERPKGLFLLDSLQQAVSVQYEFGSLTGEQSSRTTKSTAHYIREGYHVNVIGDIVDRNLAHVLFFTEISADQRYLNSSSSPSRSSNRMQFQYSLNAALFGDRYYPTAVNSSRSITNTVNQYTPSYTADTSNNGIKVTLLNATLPFTARYNRTTYDTSGSGRDTTMTSEVFSLEATNYYKDISYTHMNASYSHATSSQVGGTPVDSSVYRASLFNSLQLVQKKYTLGTQMNLQQQMSTYVPTDSFDWSETLFCQFGNALTGNFTGRYSRTSTTTPDNVRQTSISKGVDGSLSHKLYESLTTLIAGHYTQANLLGGSETVYGGRAEARYGKKLPWAGRLNITVSDDQKIRDRGLRDSVRFVRDEPHLNAQWGDYLPLVPGANWTIIEIKGRPPGFPAEYRETVATGWDPPDAQGRVRVQIAGTIVPGTDLYITYTVRVDTNIKYSTNTLNSQGSVSILNGLFRVAGRLAVQKQDVISGTDSNLVINDSRQGDLELNANFTEHALVVAYGFSDVGENSSTHYSARWNYNHRFPASLLSLFVWDQYVQHDATSLSKGYNENTLSGGATYSQPFFSWANVVLTGNYSHTTSDILTRDYAYLRATLNGRINQLEINIYGQSLLRISGPSSTREDTARFVLTRYF